ncbi:MAG: ABC transporter permease [Pseudomonadales bacterium]|jgi:NitT/TauT family transport system permease protein|nr:ABC transporter permease [Pseudomonadales bacterium]HMU89405.1 ABC transporter permease [Pseudomonadales bacterium]HMW14714.1 ABC transporter permease [Pseudomonadales bacterium]HMY95798.1 ABC transporter permease [Pseudomonadales bacterium]HMZ70288.1 ABC transporter permease [Pseudomonadales bacterium]
MNSAPRPHYIVEQQSQPVGLEAVTRSAWHWLFDRPLVRQLGVVILLCLLWEVTARQANAPLLLPTLGDTLVALRDAMVAPQGDLLAHLWESLRALCTGFAVGSVIATLLVILAINLRFGETLLGTITSGFAPLPAVAIFPLALMWFGISWSSIVFITSWATLFPVAVAMFQGFRSVPDTLRQVGLNIGLHGLGYTLRILVPASLPSIMTGIRGGVANAFRALIAIEMVLGAVSGNGGLGWFVMTAKQNLEMPTVYAGILAIMLIGLLFEGLFSILEQCTIRRWGMVH